MAATNHSERLGLSLWEQTDCPEWADFLQDNQKLEQLAGGHIANDALHVTAQEKQFLSQRTAIVTYTGTGSGAATVSLPFLPRKLLVSPVGKPGMLPQEDGAWKVLSEIWLAGEETAYGTGGITVEEASLTAQFSQGAFSGEAGIYHALNEAGVTYAVEVEA